MNRTLLLATSMLSLLTLAGCVTDPTSRQADAAGSMPMAMMADKGMMDMCMAHMSQMTPDMMQNHMNMMQRHHQMMEPKMKPQ